MGRNDVKEAIYKEIGAITKKYNTQDIYAIFLSLSLSASPVNSIKRVSELEWIKDKMLKTSLANGDIVNLFPPAYETEFIKSNAFTLSNAPKLGADNLKVYTECGIQNKEIEDLIKDKII
jgi:crotonobetainyl-CoA:carnitine CoA-transferase CaiB-like acyl-CoA transferase